MRALETIIDIRYEIRERVSITRGEDIPIIESIERIAIDCCLKACMKCDYASPKIAEIVGKN